MNTTAVDRIDEIESSRGWRWWAKRFGAGAFVFFLVKGLVWVAIGVGAYAAVQ